MQRNANKNEMNSVILFGDSRSWKVKISKKVDQISSIDPTNWPQTGYQSKIEEIERFIVEETTMCQYREFRSRFYEISEKTRLEQEKMHGSRWMNECTEQDEISGRGLFWLTADQLCLHFLAFGGRIFCHIWHCLHKEDDKWRRCERWEERIGEIEETAKWQGFWSIGIVGKNAGI